MRGKIALALIAILLTQGTDGVRLDAARKNRKREGGGGKGFSSFLGAAGGIGAAFGMPGADQVATASKTVSGFEDAANGDATVLNSITNASGLIATDIDADVGAQVVQSGQTLDKVETAAVSGDQGQILEIVGQDVGKQVGDATGSIAIQKQIQDSSALTGKSINTFVDANGNPVAVAEGLGTLTHAAGAGIGGEAGNAVNTASSGVTAVGTGIAEQDAAAATRALIASTGDTLVLYDENAGTKVQDSAVVGEKLVIAAENGDGAEVVSQLANEAIVLVDDEQAKELIHEYDNDLQRGIAVGQKEGFGNALVSTLDDANATTREIILQQPTTTTATAATPTADPVQPSQPTYVKKADGSTVIIEPKQAETQVITQEDGSQVIVQKQAPQPQLMKLSDGTIVQQQPAQQQTVVQAAPAPVAQAVTLSDGSTAIVQPPAQQQVVVEADPAPAVQAVTLSDGSTAIVQQPAPASNNMTVLQPGQIPQVQVQSAAPVVATEAVTAQPTQVMMIP